MVSDTVFRLTVSWSTRVIHVSLMSPAIFPPLCNILGTFQRKMVSDTFCGGAEEKLQESLDIYYGM